MSASKKDVAETSENLPIDPELLNQMAQHAGEGFEDTSADDYAIPYLSIAQANSPQLKPTNGKYIEDLEMGQLFDTVEGAAFTAVNIVPVHRERHYVEWVPRDSGGGFVDRHPIASAIIEQTEKNEKGRDILPNGNEIIDTFYLYALIVGGDGFNRPVVISFARTSVKKYKNLMARANNLRLKTDKGLVNPPLFSHIYSLATVTEVSKAGEEFFNWDVQGSPVPISDAGLFGEAVALREALAAGTRGAADPEEESASTASTPSTDDDEPAF